MGGDKNVFVGVERFEHWDAGIVPEGNSLAPFVVKRMGYQYEDEVRAVIQDMPVSDGRIGWSEPLVPGINVPVDASRLLGAFVKTCGNHPFRPSLDVS